MPFLCKNLCNKERSNMGRGQTYRMGYKYCAACRMYKITSEIRCFCCGALLRIKPIINKHRDYVYL